MEKRTALDFRSMAWEGGRTIKWDNNSQFGWKNHKMGK